MATSKNPPPSGLLVAVVAIAALYLARVVVIPLGLALLFLPSSDPAGLIP